MESNKLLSSSVKVKALKQKQENWMKERSETNNSAPTATKNLKYQTSNKSMPLNARKIESRKQTDVLLWNTASKDSSYSGFVVRNKTPGATKSSKSHCYRTPHTSLINFSKRPDSANSNKFCKSNSSKILKQASPECVDVCHSTVSSDYSSPETVLFTTMCDLNHNKMNNHTCRLCHEIMRDKSNSPQIVYPCGHSFCLSCLTGQKICPECRCSIMSIELNDTLFKIIQKFQDELKQNELKKKEVEAKKYLDEYQSLDTRSKVMQEDASSIIDTMESITRELLLRKNASQNIEKTAGTIKAEMKVLAEKLNSLQAQHSSEMKQIRSLEEEYDSCKSQLLVVEKTLKTINKSKERVRVIAGSIAPGMLDD